MIPLQQVEHPRYTFGPERFARIGSATVRLSDDLRKAVIFLGVRTPGPDGGERFVAAGTGFWLNYDGWSHLVTCRHVAKSLDGSPFTLRCNLKTGTVAYADIERMDWFYHPDKSVDVAAVPLGLADDAEWLVLPQAITLTKALIDERRIGIGDFAYVIGLFRLLQGTKRNLPVVHTGNIALMPGDDPLPVWDKVERKLYEVEGYLVEAHSIDGLSGAPVFARRTFALDESRKSFLGGEIGLLGMWQSSWGGEPSKELAVGYSDMGQPISVPLGLGIVVPADKIIETLELADLKKERERRKELSRKLAAASTQSAPIAKSAGDDGEPEAEEHRERFSRLLDAAVKQPKSSD